MAEIVDLPEDLSSTSDMYLIVYRASAGAQKSRKIARDAFLEVVAYLDDDVSFGIATCDEVVAQTSLTIGATVVTSCIKATGTLTLSAIADGASETDTFAVSGAAAGDVVLLTVDGPADGLAFNAYVSAADTVTVKSGNFSGSPFAGASYSVYMLVIRAA